MRDSLLICIIGPDGAGKSTQAEMLIDELERRGDDCMYRWLGFSHFLSLPLLGLARVLGLSEVETLDSGLRIGYHNFERSKVFSWFYPITLLVDTFFALILKIYIPKKILGYSVVCDRFIHDTIVNIMLSTNRSSFLDSRVGRAYLYLIPDDIKVFVMIAEEEVLRSRRDDVRADKSLGRKVELYGDLADTLNLVTIDADQDPKAIQNQICQYL